MADTVAVHRFHLLLPYVRARNSQEKIDSARELIKVALRDTSMLPAHRKHLLKLAQWWVTEADGKWKTRFRSVEVVRLARDDPLSEVRINHEHVYGRAQLADRMLRDHEQASEILELCVGCVVTVEEHGRLTAERNAQGWDRYVEAKVPVLDTAAPGWPVYLGAS